jgi:hypothetical protein
MKRDGRNYAFVAISREPAPRLVVLRGTGMRGNVDRTLYGFALRVEGIQLVAGCKPDALTVVRHTVHTLDARKRPVLSNDLGGR